MWAFAYVGYFPRTDPDGNRQGCLTTARAVIGAVFGQKFGWERPNFFATDGMEQKDDWSFRRSKWFEAIKKECQNVKDNVGLLDMTAFAKCRIKGPKAEEFLDHLVANKLPKKIGRIGLCHALNTKGGFTQNLQL